MWSEDYQVELMSRHFKAFDELRKKGWFIGEFIWNFADFKTAQSKNFCYCIYGCVMFIFLQQLQELEGTRKVFLPEVDNQRLVLIIYEEGT